MRNRKYTYLAAILIALVSGNTVTAQSLQKLYTPEDGLSGYCPTYIFQDSEDVLWICSMNGLNSFNSQSFYVYNSDRTDFGVVSHGSTFCIREQRPGTLWVSTAAGLDRIHSHTWEGNTYLKGVGDRSSSADIISFDISSDRILFCAVQGWGAAWFNEQKSKMEEFNIPEVSTASIKKILCCGNDRLCILTKDGSLYFAGYNLSPPSSISVGNVILAETNVEDIFRDGDKAISISAGRAIKYNGDGTISSLNIPEHSGQLFIANGRDGVSTLSIRTTDGFYSTFSLDFENKSCSADGFKTKAKINSIFYGTEGTEWLALDGMGLLQIYPVSAEFDICRKEEFRSSSYIESISCFAEDKSGGNILVGTAGGGLFVAKSRTSEGVRPVAAVNSNYINALENGDRDRIFAGTSKGVDSFIFKNGLISEIQHLEGLDENSTALYYDKKDRALWVGTWGSGLIRYIPENGEKKVFAHEPSIENSLSSNIITTIVPDKDGHLWIGTLRGGLNRLDHSGTDCLTFTRKNTLDALPSDDILDIFIDSDGDLWLATNNGICRMTKSGPGSYEFFPYGRNDGLASLSAHCIKEDADGFLWISTDAGISRLDKETGSFRNFIGGKALEGNEFVNHAGLFSKDSLLLFGGMDGYNQFKPKDLKLRSFNPTVHFLILSNKTFLYKDGQADSGITFDYDERSFRIHFINNEFINNEHCEYAFKLEGRNGNWEYLGTDRQAFFTNIRPGRYILSAKCTNGDKIWSNRISRLEITIHHPWWFSWWAIAIYVLNALFLLYIVFFLKKKAMDREKAIEEALVSKKKQQETFDAKLNFFSRVASEFEAPLTVISGASEQVGEEFNLSPKMEKYINSIKTCSARMLGLIQELTEFKRIGEGNYTPKYCRTDVCKVANRIISEHSETWASRGIRINPPKDSQRLTLISDAEALEKAFSYLIAYAVTHTPDKGRVDLNIRQSQEKGLIFSIRSIGKGIKSDDLHFPFDQYSVLESFEKKAGDPTSASNGIGMALVSNIVEILGGHLSVDSDEDRSITFTLNIPDAGEDVLDARTKEAEDESSESTGRILAVTSQVKKPVILVVNGEKSIRELVKDILDSEFRICTARNGAEAINSLRDLRPDLIITDISIPDIGGIEFLKKLKDNEITKFIPTVVLSYRADSAYETSCYEYGCEAFIYKPFHPRQFIALIRKILGSRAELKTFYSSAISSQDTFQGKSVAYEDKELMVKIIRTIEENIGNENLTPAFLAEKAHMSETKLYRKIKELASVPPVELIRNVRLNYACTLLKKTDMTIQEIMFKSGFNNRSYFYRRFEEQYHMKPKEYRNSNKQ